MNFFNTEEKCHKFLKAVLWSKGKKCPFCNGNKINEYKSNFKKNRCYSCKQDFSIRKGTIFDDSKLGLQKWFMCIHLINSSKKGVSSIQLAEQVGITQKSAWFVLHRIREACKMKTCDSLFQEICEVDEAYLSGKEKNRHMRDKVKGCKEKTIVVGIINRDIKQVKAIKVEDAKTNTLQKEIYKNIKDGSVVITDEYKGYTSLSHFRYNHKTINHSKGEYSKEEVIKKSRRIQSFKVHTNTIEGYWSLLKRGISGIYHWASKKHIQNYVNEFSYRYSTKELEGNEKFLIFLNGIENKKITYKQLICS